MIQHINKNVAKMSLDSVDWQVKENQVLYALNANIQSEDGNKYVYTNESSTEFCVQIPLSQDNIPFNIIGKLPIPEDGITVYFLVDANGNSAIGYSTQKDKSCTELDVIDTDCGCHKGTHLETSLKELNVGSQALPCDTQECWWYSFKNNESVGVYNVTFLNCEGNSVTDGLAAGATYNFYGIKDSVVYDPTKLTLVTSRFNRDVELDCNPTTVMLSACCDFNIIHDDTLGCKLGFSIKYPIRAVYKKNQCETLIYFGAKNIPPRKFSLYNFANKSSCGKPYTDFDCNKARFFPEICHPEIKYKDVTSGGVLKSGTYQVAVAYASKEGFEYTDYFDLTQPISIFERTITDLTNYVTDKAINIEVVHNTDIYNYINVVVAETVNNVTNYHVQGTYPVSKSGVTTVSITGDWKSSFDSIKTLVRNPFYLTADIFSTNGEVLMLADLKAEPTYNLQLAVNKVKLQWETVELTEGINDYSNPIIGARFKGYERDEVYAFGIQFLMKTGKYSCVYPVANREATAYDSFMLIPDSKDVFDTNNVCDDISLQIPRWKVYNTAGNAVSAINTLPEECGVKNHLKGDFGYYESQDETYPCNEDIWGDLAGKKLRFHKFPDSLITHIHNNQGNIYPIGVSPEKATVDAMLNTNVVDPITNELKKLGDLICGFKIVRSNRVNNKSVLAKGLLYNVGKYEPTDENGNTLPIGKVFYPNYPFNDLRKDPYISTWNGIYDTPDISNLAGSDVKNLDGFSYPEMHTRYTFHSPNTHFFKPTLGSELKLETEEFGKWKGHFVDVLDHPKYKFLTKTDSILATILGVASGLGHENKATVADGGAVTSFDNAEALAAYNTIRDLIEKAIPLRNFAKSFHAIGDYSDYIPVQNNGFKRRLLDIKAYVSPIIQDVKDIHPIHNYHRESSVYFKITDDSIPFNATVNIDNSRQKIQRSDDVDGMFDYANRNKENIYETRTGKISAFYASNKRMLLNQYGSLESIQYLDTGTFYQIEKISNLYSMIEQKYPCFGGDVFINKFSLKRKHTFFNQNMVGRPDNIDFNYQYVPNLGYPIYYMGTQPDEKSLSQLISSGGLGVLVAGVIAALFPLVGSATGLPLSLVSASMLSSILTGLVAKNNLDWDTTPVIGINLQDLLNPATTTGAIRDLINNVLPNILKKGNTIFYQSGCFYLNNIGISTFYVESDVNTDYRHGRNLEEENFYPNVGSDIPDNWLQEKNVPISRDNSFMYNKTFSKQSFENYRCNFTSVDPIEKCLFDLPNRVIYSEVSNQEELGDAWTIFKTNNYYDFPKTNGKLINLAVVENEKVYALFENTLEIYNSRVIANSTSPYLIELGTGSMFQNKPVDVINADTGYLGTQHTAFINNKYGAFWVDAKRGKIYNFNKSLEEISAYEAQNWFRQNLPFKILEQYPDVDINNPYNNIGISIGWDPKFERVFITKLDWEVKKEFLDSLLYDKENKQFYLTDGTLVDNGDPIYFNNHSFTISYMPEPQIKGWISFHSFLPRYYISHANHFESGTGRDIWKHNMHLLDYQHYYGDFYPYILEYTIPNGTVNQTISSITLIEDIVEYMNDQDYYSLMTKNSRNYNINFTKAIIYNQEQSTGVLSLIEQPIHNMQLKLSYPKYKNDEVEILYSKREGMCTFNTIFDATANQKNGQPLFSSVYADIQSQYPIDKVVNEKAISYTKQGIKKRLKSTMCRIRLINDKHYRYNFKNHFQLTKVT